MLTSILKTIGLKPLLSVLSEALGRVDSDKAKRASGLINEVKDMLNQADLSEDAQQQVFRHAEAVLALELEKDGRAIAEVNQSLRTEIASQDQYVRRMRPTFGYLMALTWTAQMLAIAYVIVFDTARADVVLQAIGALSPIWAVGLSVLGIYVYKRSEDKKLFNA